MREETAQELLKAVREQTVLLREVLTERPRPSQDRDSLMSLVQIQQYLAEKHQDGKRFALDSIKRWIKDGKFGSWQKKKGIYTATRREVDEWLSRKRPADGPPKRRKGRPPEGIYPDGFREN